MTVFEWASMAILVLLALAAALVVLAFVAGFAVPWAWMKGVEARARWRYRWHHREQAWCVLVVGHDWQPVPDGVRSWYGGSLSTRPECYCTHCHAGTGVRIEHEPARRAWQGWTIPDHILHREQVIT